jgi:adenine phosphoribosyltransferase
LKIKFIDLVKIYRGEKFFTTHICGLKRKLPIRQVDKDMWIASNHPLVLGRDVEFTKRIGKKLSKIIKNFNPDYLITAESKSLPLTYKISELLNLPEMIVARKNVKSYMENSYIKISIKSITTAEPQKLVLESDQVEKIRKKRIAIVDDVVSTGGTLTGLEKLVESAGGIITCKAAVWLEGPWYKKRDLIHLGILPVFVSKNKFEEMKKLFGGE